MFDESTVTLWIAFVGGIITFFASCLLPLVPTYLAYLTGVVVGKTDEKSADRVSVWQQSLWFVVGFIGMFTLLGYLSVHAGQALGSVRPWVEKVGGVFMVVMGLFMLGVIKPAILYKELRLQQWSDRLPVGRWRSLIFGMVFGLAWTPCIGPVLAVILYWASLQDRVIEGVLLLFVYGVGLGLPFLVIGLLFDRVAPYIGKAARWTHYLQWLAGGIIAVAGVLLILGELQAVSIWLVTTFGLNALAV